MKRQKYKPNPYQEMITAAVLETPRIAVWAGMGTGKTVSILTALDRLNLMGVDGPALVIAPSLVAKTTWPEEVDKWEHLKWIKTSVIVGTAGERTRAASVKANLYTINYESLHWLVEYFGESWPFRLVIADESTRLKGFRTRQGTRIGRSLGKIAHTKIDRLIELTGTPATNGLIDLWGQLWMLDAGKALGTSHAAFTDRWFYKKSVFATPRPHEYALDEINERVKPLVVAIRPEDWFALEKPIRHTIYVELPPKVREQYKELENEYVMWVEEKAAYLPAELAVVRSGKLLQVASGSVYLKAEFDENGKKKPPAVVELHDQKIEVLKSIVNEANGAPVIVAYNYKFELEKLKKTFPKGAALTRENSTILTRQWNDGDIPVLFVHPRTAGHGLNLQYGGNILVYFGPSWRLEERLQVLERIGPVRQAQAGFKRPVYVYDIIARDTIDELVISREDGKKDILQSLMEFAARRKQQQHGGIHE